MALANVVFQSNSVLGSAVVQANAWLAANPIYVLWDYEYGIDEDAMDISPPDRIVIRYSDVAIAAYNPFVIQFFSAQTTTALATALNAFYTGMTLNYIAPPRVVVKKPDMHNSYETYYSVVLYNTNQNNGEDNARGQLTRRARGIPYNNTVSGLVSTDVQNAIDEIVAGVGANGDIVDVPVDYATIEAAATYLNLREGGIIQLSADPPALAANTNISKIIITGSTGNAAGILPTITFNGGSFIGNNALLKKVRINVANAQTGFAMTGAATNFVELENVAILGAAGGILANSVGASTLMLQIDQVNFTGMGATIFGAGAAGYTLNITDVDISAAAAIPIGAGGAAVIYADDTFYRTELTGALATWNLTTKDIVYRVGNRRYPTIAAVAATENAIVVPTLTANMTAGGNTSVLAGAGLSLVNDAYAGWILHITDVTVNPGLNNFYRVVGFTGATATIAVDRELQQTGGAITCELINPIRINIQGTPGIRTENLLIDKHFIITGRGRDCDTIIPVAQIVPTADTFHGFEKVSVLGRTASWAVGAARYAMFSFDDCRVGSTITNVFTFTAGAGNGGMIQFKNVILNGNLLNSKDFFNLQVDRLTHENGMICLQYAASGGAMIINGGYARFIRSYLSKFYQFYAAGAGTVLTPGAAVGAIDDSSVAIANCVFNDYSFNTSTDTALAMFYSATGASIATTNARTHSLYLDGFQERSGAAANVKPIAAVAHASDGATATISTGTINFNGMMEGVNYVCLRSYGSSLASTVTHSGGVINFNINALDSTVIYADSGSLGGIADIISITGTVIPIIKRVDAVIVGRAYQNGTLTFTPSSGTVLLEHCSFTTADLFITANAASTLTLNPGGAFAIKTKLSFIEIAFSMFTKTAGTFTITGTNISVYYHNCVFVNNFLLYTNAPTWAAAIAALYFANCTIEGTLSIVTGANVTLFKTAETRVYGGGGGNSIINGGVDSATYKVANCTLAGIVQTAGAAVITFTDANW